MQFLNSAIGQATSGVLRHRADARAVTFVLLALLFPVQAMLRDGPSLVDLALVPAACVMAFLSSLVSPVALLQRAYQSVVRTGFL